MMNNARLLKNDENRVLPALFLTGAYTKPPPKKLFSLFFKSLALFIIKTICRSFSFSIQNGIVTIFLSAALQDRR